MNVSYADGSLLAFWYGSWLVVAGSAPLWCWRSSSPARNKWSGGGLLVNTTMILAVLAASPLAMIRIGLNVAVTNHDDMGYISLVGTAVALALGLAIVMKPTRRGACACVAARPPSRKARPPMATAQAWT